ncbi:MAG: hypothetical protein JNM09_08350 [Blastocatellia bacterium]|nr:hypothetical protein [Blastocatellia bacterium]
MAFWLRKSKGKYQKAKGKSGKMMAAPLFLKTKSKEKISADLLPFDICLLISLKAF